jgi:hypothetical protein
LENDLIVAATSEARNGNKEKTLLIRKQTGKFIGEVAAKFGVNLIMKLISEQINL